MSLDISEEKLSLVNLGGGAAIEKFDTELQKVLDNISDPNTIETAARTVVLKVTIKPKDRTYAPVSIHCGSKLADDQEYDTNIYIGKDVAGRVAAYEHNPEQLKLQFEQRQQGKKPGDDGSGKVTHLKEGRK